MSTPAPRSLEVVALDGDGIGPEILRVALAVLEAAGGASGLRVEVRVLPSGAAVAARLGAPVADDALEACRAAGVVLKAPTGLPSHRAADGTEIGMASGYLRGRLGLWANVRPARRLPDVPVPVREFIDCVVVRENSEGIYASRGRTVRTAEAAVDLVIVTRAATRRVARLACRLADARTRPGRGAGTVTCVDKANVLGTFALFRQVAAEVAAEFPGVRFETMHADAAAAALVGRPQVFDVVLAENLLGDVLSDLAGAAAGGIGLAPSANIGDGVALFEPIHGSAPDLAGTDRANPIGQVLSAAMLLEWVGEAAAGALIEDAVDAALAGGHLHVEPDGSLREGLREAARALPALVREASARPAPSRPLLLPIAR